MPLPSQNTGTDIDNVIASGAGTAATTTPTTANIRITPKRRFTVGFLSHHPDHMASDGQAIDSTPRELEGPPPARYP